MKSQNEAPKEETKEKLKGIHNKMHGWKISNLGEMYGTKPAAKFSRKYGREVTGNKLNDSHLTSSI